MKNTLRRTLIMLLALTMIFTSIPIFVSSAQTTLKVGDIVEFGSYPQSEVTDSSLKSKLTSLAGAANYWTSYGYYSGSGSWSDGKMTAKDYMKYTDVTYNGAKYRGVYFTEYRPDCTGYTSSSTDQDDNGYSTSTQYWFKFDPIKWRVLDPSTGLVMAETILDSQAYNNYLLYSGSEYYGDASKTYYANNWEHSSIRKWLNTDFLNTAFSSEEQNNIKETTLSTPAYSTSYSKYDSADTLDKVFLLSYTDVQNTAYGFASRISSSDTRTAQGSSYAKCQGLWVYSGNGNSRWLLRSGGSYSGSSCGVSDGGYVYNLYDAGSTDDGVRPALLLQSLNQASGSECEHSYKTTVIPATCTEKGYTTHTCTKCGDSYTDTETDALGHTYNDGVITVKPTCTDKGVKTFTCTRTGCTASYTEEIAALGHAYNDGVITVKPTCTDKGTKTYTCTRIGCTASYTEEIDALGHDIVNHDAKAPTCTEIGWDAYDTCSRCDYTTYVEKAALGHDIVKHEAKAPTCTEKGWDAYDTCSRCDYTTYVEKAALGHDIVKHDAKAPTCTEIGWDVYDTCSRCDYTTYVEKAALGHDIVKHDAKVPTCTEIGWDAYDTCSRCDYTTYVEKPVLGHTEAEAVKENEVAATTKATGSYDSVVYCSVCGEKLSSETVVIDKIPEIRIDVKSNDHLALVNGILVIDKTVTEKDIFDNTNATQIVNADDTENTDGVLKTEMKANVFTGAELTDSIAMALLGDVDCDGDVDVADARLALRAAVRLDILVGARFAAADVDFSNDISVSDARTILRIAVKLEDGTDLIAKRKAD